MKWVTVLLFVALAIDGLRGHSLGTSSGSGDKKTSRAVGLEVGLSKENNVTLTKTDSREEHTREQDHQNSHTRSATQRQGGSSQTQVESKRRRTQDVKRNESEQYSQSLSLGGQERLLQSQQTSTRSGDETRKTEEYDKDHFNSHSIPNSGRNQDESGQYNLKKLLGSRGSGSTWHTPFTHIPRQDISESLFYNQNRHFGGENGHYGSRYGNYGGPIRHIGNSGNHNGRHVNGIWNHPQNNEQFQRGTGHQRANHFVGGTGFQGANSAEYINQNPFAGSRYQTSDVNEGFRRALKRGQSQVYFNSGTADQGTNAGEYVSGIITDGTGYQSPDEDFSEIFRQEPYKPNYISGIGNQGQHLNGISPRKEYSRNPNEYLNGLFSHARGAVNYPGTTNPEKYINGGFVSGGASNADQYAIKDDSEDENSKNINDIPTQAQYLLEHSAEHNAHGVTPVHHHSTPVKRGPLYATPNQGIRFYDTATGSYMANPSSATDAEIAYEEVVPGYVVPTVIAPGFNAYSNDRVFRPISYYRNGGFSPGFRYDPDTDGSSPTTIYGRSPIINLAPVLPISDIPVRNAANDDGLLIDRSLTFAPLTPLTPLTPFTPLTPLEPLAPLKPLIPVSPFNSDNEGTSGDSSDISDIIIDREILTQYDTTQYGSEGTIQNAGTVADSETKRNIHERLVDKTVKKHTEKHGRDSGKIYKTSTKTTTIMGNNEKTVVTEEEDDRTRNNGRTIVIDKTKVIENTFKHGTNEGKKDQTVEHIKKGSGKDSGSNNKDSDKTIKNSKSFVTEKTEISANKNIKEQSNDKTAEKTKNVLGSNHGSKVTDNKDDDSNENDKTTEKSIVIRNTDKYESKKDKIYETVEKIEKVQDSKVTEKSSVIESTNKNGKAEDKNDKTDKIEKRSDNSSERDSKYTDEPTKNINAVVTAKPTVIKSTNKNGKAKDKNNNTEEKIEKSSSSSAGQDAKNTDKIVKNTKAEMTKSNDQDSKHKDETVEKINIGLERDKDNDATSTDRKPVEIEKSSAKINTEAKGQKEKKVESVKQAKDSKTPKSSIDKTQKALIKIKNTYRDGSGNGRIDTNSTETTEVSGTNGKSGLIDSDVDETTNNVNKKTTLVNSDEKEKTVKDTEKVSEITEKSEPIENNDNKTTKTGKAVVIDTTIIRNSNIDNGTKNNTAEKISEDSRTNKKTGPTDSNVDESTKNDEIIVTEKTTVIKNSSEDKKDTSVEKNKRHLRKDDRSNVIDKDDDNAAKPVKSIDIEITTVIKKGSEKEPGSNSNNDDDTTKHFKSLVTEKKTENKNIEKYGKDNDKKDDIVKKNKKVSEADDKLDVTDNGTDGNTKPVKSIFDKATQIKEASGSNFTEDKNLTQNVKLSVIKKDLEKDLSNSNKNNDTENTNSVKSTIIKKVAMINKGDRSDINNDDKNYKNGKSGVVNKITVVENTYKDVSETNRKDKTDKNTEKDDIPDVNGDNDDGTIKSIEVKKTTMITTTNKDVSVKEQPSSEIKKNTEDANTSRLEDRDEDDVDKGTTKKSFAKKTERDDSTTEVNSDVIEIENERAFDKNKMTVTSDKTGQNESNDNKKDRVDSDDDASIIESDDDDDDDDDDVLSNKPGKPANIGSKKGTEVIRPKNGYRSGNEDHDGNVNGSSTSDKGKPAKNGDKKHTIATMIGTVVGQKRQKNDHETNSTDNDKTLQDENYSDQDDDSEDVESRKKYFDDSNDDLSEESQRSGKIGRVIRRKGQQTDYENDSAFSDETVGDEIYNDQNNASEDGDDSSNEDSDHGDDNLSSEPRKPIKYRRKKDKSEKSDSIQKEDIVDNDDHESEPARNGDKKQYSIKIGTVLGQKNYTGSESKNRESDTFASVKPVANDDKKDDSESSNNSDDDEDVNLPDNFYILSGQKSGSKVGKNDQNVVEIEDDDNSGNDSETSSQRRQSGSNAGKRRKIVSKIGKVVNQKINNESNSTGRENDVVSKDKSSLMNKKRVVDKTDQDENHEDEDEEVWYDNFDAKSIEKSESNGSKKGKKSEETEIWDDFGSENRDNINDLSVQSDLGSEPAINSVNKYKITRKFGTFVERKNNDDSADTENDETSEDISSDTDRTDLNQNSGSKCRSKKDKQAIESDVRNDSGNEELNSNDKGTGQIGTDSKDERNRDKEHKITSEIVTLVGTKNNDGYDDSANTENDGTFEDTSSGTNQTGQDDNNDATINETQNDDDSELEDYSDNDNQGDISEKFIEVANSGSNGGEQNKKAVGSEDYNSSDNAIREQNDDGQGSKSKRKIITKTAIIVEQKKGSESANSGNDATSKEGKYGDFVKEDESSNKDSSDNDDDNENDLPEKFRNTVQFGRNSGKNNKKVRESIKKGGCSNKDRDVGTNTSNSGAKSVRNSGKQGEIFTKIDTVVGKKKDKKTDSANSSDKNYQDGNNERKKDDSMNGAKFGNGEDDAKHEEVMTENGEISRNRNRGAKKTEKPVKGAKLGGFKHKTGQKRQNNDNSKDSKDSESNENSVDGKSTATPSSKQLDVTDKTWSTKNYSKNRDNGESSKTLQKSHTRDQKLKIRTKFVSKKDSTNDSNTDKTTKQKDITFGSVNENVDSKKSDFRHEKRQQNRVESTNNENKGILSKETRKDTVLQGKDESIEDAYASENKTSTEKKSDNNSAENGSDNASKTDSQIERETTSSLENNDADSKKLVEKYNIRNKIVKTSQQKNDNNDSGDEIVTVTKKIDNSTERSEKSLTEHTSNNGSNDDDNRSNKNSNGDSKTDSTTDSSTDKSIDAKEQKGATSDTENKDTHYTNAGTKTTSRTNASESRHSKKSTKMDSTTDSTSGKSTGSDDEQGKTQGKNGAENCDEENSASKNKETSNQVNDETKETSSSTEKSDSQANDTTKNKSSEKRTEESSKSSSGYTSGFEEETLTKEKNKTVYKRSSEYNDHSGETKDSKRKTVQSGQSSASEVANKTSSDKLTEESDSNGSKKSKKESSSSEDKKNQTSSNESKTVDSKGNTEKSKSSSSQKSVQSQQSSSVKDESNSNI